MIENASNSVNVFPNLFEDAVKKYSTNIAACYLNQTITYEELNAASDQLALYMQNNNISKGDLVGLFMNRSIDLLIQILAIFKVGAVYVPIDPLYPKLRIEYIVKDANIKHIFTNNSLRQLLKNMKVKLHVFSNDTHTKIKPAQFVKTTINACDLAYVIYTSGSTGKPKGVKVNHGALSNYLNWCIKTYFSGAGIGSLVHSSISFDATITSLFSPLLVGKKVVLLSEKDEIGDLVNELSLGKNYSLIKITPSHINAISELVPEDKLSSAAEVLVIGGEALHGKDIAKWRQCAPNVRIINEYGPTESAVGCCTYEVNEYTKLDSYIPIGTPIDNVSLYNLDENLKPVSIGDIGELYIGGRSLADGYLNNEALTKDKFVDNPYCPNNTKLYMTGDLVKSHFDGSLEYIGRKDNQVKVRGYRVEVDEIDILLRKHNNIKQACTIVVKKNNSHNQLVSYIALKNNDPNTNYKDYLKSELPEYMLPVEINVINSIPLTTNGKIDKDYLIDLYSKKVVINTEKKLNQDGNLKILTEIWSSVLGKEQIDIHDNFFELGGDSIMSIQVVGRAKKAGFNITPKDMFEHQTLASLITKLAIDTSPNKPIDSIVEGEFILSPIQAWFFDKVQENVNYYNLSFVIKAKQKINIEYLKKAMNVLLEHHDALRSYFYINDKDEWLQCSDKPVNDPVHHLVLEKYEENSLREAYNNIQKSLNIQEGNLLKLLLVTFNDSTESRILLVAHHLIIDGLSLRIFLEDLNDLYTQFENNQFVSLPHKTISFKEWTLYLSNNYLSVQEIRRKREYWISQIKKINTTLPLDYPSCSFAENKVSTNETIELILNEEETNNILTEIPKIYNAGINEVLLSILSVSLSKNLTPGYIGIEMDSHGRDIQESNIDISRTIGWFTTIYPYILKIDPNASFEEIILYNKKNSDNISTKSIGYSILANIAKEPALSMEPLQFPIAFNYLGKLNSNDNIFQYTMDHSGDMIDPKNNRNNFLIITSIVIEKKLRFFWNYSAALHKKETIQNYVDEFRSSIKNLEKRIDNINKKIDIYSPLVCLNAEEFKLLENKYKTIEDIYLLTHMQKGMLYDTLYLDKKDVYSTFFSYKLKGSFDIDLLKNAWLNAIKRHAILRTSFVWEGLGEPHQLVHDDIEFPWLDIDFSSLAKKQRDLAIAEYLNIEVKKGFNLDKPPLIKLILIKLSNKEYQFVFLHHHLLLDGWSAHLLLNEIFGIEKNNLSVNFKQYIEWFYNHDTKKARSYFIKEYDAFIPSSIAKNFLINDPEKVDKNEFEIDKLRLCIDSTVTNKLNKLLRETHVTFNNLIQSVWAFIACNYSNASEVSMGITYSGRTTEIENINEAIGMFINTLPLKLSVNKKDSFTSILKEAQRKSVYLEEFLHTSITDIKKWCNLTETRSLFEAILVFENYPTSTDFMTKNHFNVEIEKLPAHPPMTGSNLLLVSGFENKNFMMDIYFNKSVFSQPLISYLQKSIETVLLYLSNGLDVPIQSIPLLNEKEKIHSIIENKKSGHDKKNILSIFKEQVSKSKNEIAIKSQGIEISYAELDRRSDVLASYLLKNTNVKNDKFVALFLERSLETIIAIVAILKAGGIYVPIDPNYPQARVTFIIQDAKISTVITNDQYKEMFHKISEIKNIINLSKEINSDGNDVIHFTKSMHLFSPEEIACLFYTSGSTGIPKGALISHKNICNLILNTNFVKITKMDSILHASNVSFDAATFEIWGALLNGAKTVIISKEDLLSSERFFELIRNENVGIVFLTTSLFNIFATDGNNNFSSLKILFFGGEAADPKIAQEVFKNNKPKKLINIYGPTECTTFSAFYEIKSLNFKDHVPVGIPISNAQVCIQNDLGKIVPFGVLGEICIAGDGLSVGYLNQKESTDKKFVYSSECQSKIYKTGDIGCLQSDGNLLCVGRKDDQIKFRGYRIELGEIETVVRQHINVKHTATITKECRVNNKNIIIYYSTLDGSDIKDEIIDILKAQLPEYMHPSYVIQIKDLPFTASGKIDKKVLSSLSIEQGFVNEIILPRDSLEVELKQIFEDLLEIKNVSVNANFFDIGGHSLSALSLISKIKKNFNKEISLSNFFSMPSIEKIAQYLRSNTKMINVSHLVKIQPNGHKRPLFCIHPAGGHVYRYVDLARVIGKDRPLIGIKSRGFDDTLKPHDTYEEAATDYIKAIKKFQASGPYNIAGLSLGGCIAYEMAQQLKEAGEDVSLLALLDTVEPSLLPSEFEDEHPANSLAGMFAAYLSVTTSDLSEIKEQDKLKFIINKIREANRVPYGYGEEELLRLVVTRQAIAKAMTKYKPKEYNGKVDLFLAELGAVLFCNDETLGWKNFAKNIMIHRIPGEHDKITQEPHVNILAQKMSNCFSD